MSITEAILEKVRALTPEKVLHYVGSLTPSATKVKNAGEPCEWMKIAMSMNLDGPPDLSEHLDDNLYGDKKNAW